MSWVLLSISPTQFTNFHTALGSPKYLLQLQLFSNSEYMLREKWGSREEKYVHVTKLKAFSVIHLHSHTSFMSKWSP